MSERARIAGLKRLLRPRHMAVFGGRFAEAVIRQSERIGFSGDIWPVNPARAQIAGRPCFSDFLLIGVTSLGISHAGSPMWQVGRKE